MHAAHKFVIVGLGVYFFVMPGLVPGIYVSLPKPKTWMTGDKPGHDEGTGVLCRSQHAAGSPTISGCRASATAGDIQITSACAAKIAVAR